MPTWNRAGCAPLPEAMALHLSDERLSFGAVDNFPRRAILFAAEKSGIVDKVCNLLMRLEIPLMGK